MLFSSLRKSISLHLGTKFILAVILLLSAISVTLTSFFIKRQEGSLTDELRKRAFSLASNVAFNSQYAVLSGDIKTMQNLLAGVKQEIDIREAFIIDLDGKILAHQDPDRMGKTVSFSGECDTLQQQKWILTEDENIWRTINLIEIERKQVEGDEILLFSSPENVDSQPGGESKIAYREKLGFVVLAVSLENMNRAVAAATRHAIIITLIMVLLGALAVIYLVRSVVVPIYHLANATKAVAQGEFDQEVPINRLDEIGVLANSFNNMIRQLKLSREEIEAWNRELEAKVAERTKELEEKHFELEKAYEELKTLDKAKDDFLSLVSHELRTPLSSVLLYSEMLLDGITVSEESRTEFLSTIVDNCKRLTRLINDVLDLSKIEAGRMPFKLVQLKFRSLVGETLSGLRPNIEGKGIEFICGEVDDRIRLWGDKDKVIQVLTNIVSNATKFTPKGGEISVSLTDCGDMGLIAVKDTGKGIRKEDIPKVFDRFSHLESIDHHHSEGTGLGMTISKSLIERLGGEIWIESKLGQGTTVFFTLPKARRVSGIRAERMLEDGA
ncbi:MAG: HAMP domain-containing protein [Candidatus Glassbacteria bacterium]|nr:HAMP domain-containing protein [Candidatus Glassbacteria bacterium]